MTTETTDKPTLSVIGIIITTILFVLIGGLVLTQRGLGAITESKQAQELDKLLGGIKAVCGDSNHPEVTDLYVSVFGGHQIRYERDINNFGSEKKKIVELACKANCLCAFNGDNPIQCTSMFDQQGASCQDIDIREDGWVSTSKLEFPGADLITGILPKNTCKFQLKLKWDGSSSPNRVLVQKIGIQTLTYTTGSELWASTFGSGISCNF